MNWCPEDRPDQQERKEKENLCVKTLTSAPRFTFSCTFSDYEYICAENEEKVKVRS
jgi:hypothetical protein